MRVLVTGGTGLVGTALLARFGASDDASAIRARLALRAAPAALAIPTGTEVVEVGPHEGPVDWGPALAGVEAVVHLAARVHLMRDGASDPLGEFRRVNTEASLRLAREAAAAGVRRFVYLSSLKVHGESGRFRETDAPVPQDPYSISKREAEIGLRAIAEETGLEVVVLRPPLVYGPGVRANFLTLMRAVARGWPLPLGAVENQRSLVGVDNLADLIVRLLLHPSAAGEDFLVSDGEDLSTPSLIRRLGAAMDRPVRLFPVPPALLRAGAALTGRGASAERLLGTLVADIGKARSLLHWTPPVTLDEGLRRAVRGVL